jgi:hypothetical protein
MAIETVASYEEILELAKTFNKGLERVKIFKDDFRYYRSWYYLPELDAVAPSKFIRYKGMTDSEYTRIHAELDAASGGPVLDRWFKHLKENSPEAMFVKQKVEELAGRYGKFVNISPLFNAPWGWAIKGKEQVLIPARPTVERFWQEFLDLSPEDNQAITERIINRNFLE